MDFRQLASKHGQETLEYAMHKYLEKHRQERQLNLQIRQAEASLEDLRRKR